MRLWQITNGNVCLILSLIYKRQIAHRTANHYFMRILFCALPLLFLGCTAEESEHSHTHSQVDNADGQIELLKIENLLRDSLALAPDVEIVVSYLEMPDTTDLPAHYHPGEEFVYVIEGSGELTLEGAKTVLNEGEFIKIPYKAVHSFRTIDEQARAVVFRVHEPGQPDRILVE